MSGEWKDGQLDDGCCCLPAMLCEVVPCHPDMGLERERPSRERCRGDPGREGSVPRGSIPRNPMLQSQRPS